MKVSVDGLRRNLARAFSKAVRGYHEVVEGERPPYDTLRDGLDELRQMIGAFMCMYSDDPADLMTNMTEEAEKLPLVEDDDA